MRRWLIDELSDPIADGVTKQRMNGGFDPVVSAGWMATNEEITEAVVMADEMTLMKELLIESMNWYQYESNLTIWHRCWLQLMNERNI